VNSGTDPGQEGGAPELTADRIRAIEPGRELDALVAVRVLGFAPVAWDEETPCPECGGEMRYCGERSRCCNCSEWRCSPYREYSSEIAPAWEVVDQMHGRGVQWLLKPLAGGLGKVYAVEEGGRTRRLGDRAPLPLAICRAGLLAVLTAGPSEGP
jgi:hypothetical protein